jgi:RNA polymerase sigma-70 factor (ECF subfamily)
MIVRQYSEPLYWKIRHFVLSHEDANDVLQDTFIKAWTNLDSFKGESKIVTWLYRIAINLSLDFIRKQKNASSISADEDVTVASRLLADDYFDGDEMQAQLQEAIATLPEVQRMVFNLRYFDEMKYSEMSKLLDTSEGALKASYHIAVQKITEYFKHKD